MWGVGAGVMSHVSRSCLWVQRMMSSHPLPAERIPSLCFRAKCQVLPFHHANTRSPAYSRRH